MQCAFHASNTIWHCAIDILQQELKYRNFVEKNSAVFMYLLVFMCTSVQQTSQGFSYYFENLSIAVSPKAFVQ